MDINPNYPEAYFNLAEVYGQSGQVEEAINNYIKASKLKPSLLSESMNNLGIIHLNLGKSRKAIQYFKKAIKHNPKNARANRNLSSVIDYKVEDKHLNHIKTLVGNSDIAETDLCHFNFALAKAYEDLETYDKSFKHYVAGNSLRKKLLKYNFKQDVKLFERVKSLTS